MRTMFGIAGVLMALALAGRATMGCSASDGGDAVAEDSGTIDDSASPPGTPIDGGAAVDADASSEKTCSADGWCHTSLPFARIAEARGLELDQVSVELRDIWVMPDHEAWAVTDQGYVLRWKAGTWELAFDAKRPLVTVWASSSGDVWLGGRDGLVLHGGELGGTVAFAPVELGSSETVTRILGMSAGDVWAITNTSVLHSTGGAFVTVPMPNGIAHESAKHYFADIWAHGSDLWISTFEFTSCDREDPECPYQERIALVRWRGGAPLDAGSMAAWERVPLAARNTYLVAGGAATPDGVQFVNMTGFNGATWIARVLPVDAGVLDAGAAMEAGGDYVWTRENGVPSGAVPEGLWAKASDDAWVVGSPGTLRHWDGRGWKVVRASITSTPLSMPLHAIRGTRDSAGKSDVWVVGGNVALHRTEVP